MSIMLMNIVLGEGMDFLSTTERFVLLVLADAANDDGITWLPIKGKADKRSITKKTSLSERGVQKSLRTLERDGHISRQERRGHGVIYTIHPCTTCTPEPDALVALAHDMPPKPPHEVRPRTMCTGAPDTPVASTPDISPILPHKVHPRTKCTGAPHAPTPAPRAPKPSINNITPLSPPRGAEEISSKRDRGNRIPDTWVPPPIEELNDAAQLKARQWPPGAYEAEAETFRSHWLAEGGRSAYKLDWTAAWVSHIMRWTARVLQDHKAGVIFMAPSSATPAAIPQVAGLDTSREGPAAKKIRKALAKRANGTAVRQFFDKCRFDVTSEGLSIIAPSEFTLSYVRDASSHEAQLAMHDILGPDADLKWAVEKRS